MEIDRNKSEELIIELNHADQIIDEQNSPAFSSKKMFSLLPETIVDKRTLLMVEIHRLFKAINHTMTSVGSARLFHSLVNPSESIELIHAKQDSFCELTGNDRLRHAIADFLTTFKKSENELFKFLNAHTHPLFIYGNLKQVKKIVQDLLKTARSLPQPETVYLDSLIKSIVSLERSPVSELLSTPTYRTLKGIVTKAEKKTFEPALRFRPGRLSGGTLLPFMPLTFFGIAWLFQLMEPATAKYLFFFTSWFSILGVTYAGLIKPYFDWETAVLALRERFVQSDRFGSAIEAVAAIDELLSFIVYSETMPYPTAIPEVTNDPVHSFVVKDLRNPIILDESGDYVPNDAHLEGSRLTFITGPNSGGKTTYCKTIAQNQILGQIGAPVAARYAKMNMADQVIYQAPSFDTLSDLEGRFGTELQKTRDIFFSTTPKSLVVLDEIAEGTTTHEKLSLSEDIMNGFYAIGSNTLMVTHNFELVEQFKKEGKGQYLKVEFNGEIPTHRIVEGISTESHALRVARKVGFAPDDILNHLEEKGYLNNEFPVPDHSREPRRPYCRRK